MLSSSPSIDFINALIASFHANAQTSPNAADANVIIDCTVARECSIDLAI
jgi:hypothetical protein